MEFDFARFAGNLVMVLFLGTVLVVIVGKLFKVTNNRIAWGSGLVVSILFAIVVPSITGIAAAAASGVLFAAMAALNIPLPKFS